MQCEEFCKTILNDELISALLTQIKGIFYQITIPRITNWLEELEENCDHKNEMTRFIKYINENLGIKTDDNDKINENIKNKDKNYFLNNNKELKEKIEINENSKKEKNKNENKKEKKNNKENNNFIKKKNN